MLLRYETTQRRYRFGLHLLVTRHRVDLWLCLVYISNLGEPKLDRTSDLELRYRGDSRHCAFEVAKLGPLGSCCGWCLLAALPSTASA